MTVKKILFPLFSVFLLYRSFDLIRNLINTHPQDYSITEIFILSLLLALFITGVFAFTGFAYATHKMLPETYYKVKNKKLTNKLYDTLNIAFFKKILLLFFWGHKTQRKKYFNGKRTGLQSFVYQTKQSEFSHLASFIIIQIVVIILIFHNYALLGLFLTIINIFGNLYPVLLQRHHRMRIQSL
ncbi:hypothetical protein SAMN04487906_2138 [Zhouia amylolytica]|uniref:Glycosyl-4,4'-diaponeurosporenoate acyltransferase n=1 Tax=Zhouia amylolytica TaxID=376730 RepID=A0A1I6TTS8_9FLAO|nr:hypothetical protein [Zhouia amylolytica]MCQ0112580.1 hypothetical protein [Zhouia amylolytica]SFS92571.1 hypothetical protein SAMN04487906_2138 [Zhouia amylolytica]